MIKVATLGPFSVSFGDVCLSERSKRSKKAWRLIKYLAACRSRTVGSDELISVLDSRGSDSYSSLKTMIHRCRDMLSGLGCPGAERLIQSKDGGYRWNTGIGCAFDVDEFKERLADADRAVTAPCRTEALILALGLYKGFYLDRAFEEIHDLALEIQGYHLRYIQAFEECAASMLAAGDCETLCALAADAVRIDPYQETFHYFLIRACIEAGDHEKALYYYDRAGELFMEKFRINATDRIRRLYRMIIKGAHALQNDAGSARESLASLFDESGAIFCEPDTFGLVCRSAMTDPKDADLPEIAFIVLSPSDEKAFPSEKQLAHTSSALKDLLGQTLDRASFYARFAASGYMALIFSRDTGGFEERLRTDFAKIAVSSIRLDISFEKLKDIAGK